MTKDKMNRKLFLLFLLPFIFLFACSEDEEDKTALITGLWQQEKMTEDGVETARQNLSLLFEANGVYRTYANGMPVEEHFGAWSITDNQYLETTADTWRLNSDPLSQTPANQWTKNHIPVRFTILKLSDNELEIRIKTFAGEQKYAALFAEETRPLVTADNLEAIQQEYTTLKTYIYTFKKANNRTTT
jgi:hypothetical protein